MTLFRKILFLVLICLPETLFPQKNRNADTPYKIFQFPADHVPVIDGETGDWAMVPDSFEIGIDQLKDDNGKHLMPDTTNLNVKIKVGWVRGLNRLYFLYRAYDNYWDFEKNDLHHDIFELVVDGDRSGGDFISRFYPFKDESRNYRQNLWYGYQGVQAQNYHIFTPAREVDWTMVWGGRQWIKSFPYANYAYKYHFNPGEPGWLTLEFWITPFDYADADGPQRSIVSELYEDKLIGLSWAVIDFDGVNDKSNNGFWNLSDQHTMYGNADYLKPFRLMPLTGTEEATLEAKWNFKITDLKERTAVFSDRSRGIVKKWKWDFGDGTFSDEQNPVHHYAESGNYIVTLYVEGEDGKKSKFTRVWDVSF